MKKTVKIDAISKKILTVLQQDARISNIDLAAKVGLSPSACLQRTKSLEEAGYILRYVMAVDLDRICINVKIYVEISFTTHRVADLARFEETVRGIPEFVDCLRVSGRIDYIGFVVCSSVADFKDLSNDLLGRELGIARIDSYMVLDTPKWFGGYPLHRLEWKG